MRRGFTLIELLVVVAIIGLLSTIVFSSLNLARERAFDVRRQADMRTVQTALTRYYLNNGHYPQENTTTYRLSDVTAALVPKYLPSIPLDPQYGDTSRGYRYGAFGTNISNPESYTILVQYKKNNSAWCEVRSEEGDPQWTFNPC